MTASVAKGHLARDRYALHAGPALLTPSVRTDHPSAVDYAELGMPVLACIPPVQSPAGRTASCLALSDEMHLAVRADTQACGHLDPSLLTYILPANILVTDCRED